jgi:hypothetical protein
MRKPMKDSELRLWLWLMVDVMLVCGIVVIWLYIFWGD